MSDDLRALRELAEAATPGPWSVDDSRNPDSGAAHVWQANGGYGIAACRFRGQQNHLDAAFIAAANPTAVLALLDRLEAAEAAVERVRALADEDARLRQECAAKDDCECTYKDCYEHGKWHNCTHTPWTQIRPALEAD